MYDTYSVDIGEIKQGILSLTAKYSKQKSELGRELKGLSEENIKKDYVNPLFRILGWSIEDSSEYDSEKYVRGAGFADIAIKINKKPILFIEVKKFGEVPSMAQRPVQQTLTGYKIWADWTEGERQVLTYAGHALDVKWAILTNFEKFRLFNAKTGDTIVNIEQPTEYIDRLEDLTHLTKKYVQNGNINKLESRIERKDVDVDFLNFMNHWRLSLANEIHSNSPDLELEEIKRIVQRLLDRMVIIRCAEDRWILDPDQLKATSDYWEATRSLELKLFDLLNSLFYRFDTIYDSKIFEKDRLVDIVLERINPQVLMSIIKQLYQQNFRKFTSDILGSTYESYLGHQLTICNGSLQLEPSKLVRKSGGIYYTPAYVVSFIVNNTISIELEKIWNDVSVLFDQDRVSDGSKRFQDIFELSVLDEACGSGSFLIKSLQTFSEYCEKYNKLIEDTIQKANAIARDAIARGDMNEAWKWFSRSSVQKLSNYKLCALHSTIFGIDIDIAASRDFSSKPGSRSINKGRKTPSYS